METNSGTKVHLFLSGTLECQNETLYTINTISNLCIFVPYKAFEHNIVYWREADLLAGKWDDVQVVLDRNLYWRADRGEIRFGDLSWDE